MLIGYDDTRKEFLSVGYLMGSQFRVYPISYENMQKSIEALRKILVGFNFVHYCPEAKFPLRMDRIVNELSDYISSTTSMKVYTRDRFYGVEAICQLADNFVETAEEKGQIDPRYTRGLIKQKSIAVTRVKYLCE